MIQSLATQTDSRASKTLARHTLLSSALRVLDHARSVERDAHGRISKHPRAAHLIERLAAHREVLARRAANVALAPASPAEELRELREAATRLVAVQGLVTRKLGMTRLS